VVGVEKIGLDAVGGVERLLGDSGGGGGYMIRVIVGAMTGKYQQVYGANVKRLEETRERLKCGGADVRGHQKREGCK
jgi:hypothetical protein